MPSDRSWSHSFQRVCCQIGVGSTRIDAIRLVWTGNGATRGQNHHTRVRKWIRSPEVVKRRPFKQKGGITRTGAIPLTRQPQIMAGHASIAGAQCCTTSRSIMALSFEFQVKFRHTTVPAEIGNIHGRTPWEIPHPSRPIWPRSLQISQSSRQGGANTPCQI